MAQKLLHPIPEACELLSIRRTKFYEEIKAGRIVVVKIGSKTLVPHDSIERYVEALLIAAGAAP